ncbi:ABC transporter substrate-binding protein [Paenibacillus sp. UMB4589-SE434]|uniref:ABC transporter substrate-binding protein n=1 Tax=Paenibacillus sp. UMB4589-SE434 TaxID=3046314 RepID=UPI00254E3B57|nr:ABC transporter substrate-binding protein [Paenibacillus sp. UMB4589-SE434]MDK8184045.1 ABC transporter substrate-binding protein [Paenibacillus sp. UMB4589-SE434]
MLRKRSLSAVVLLLVSLLAGACSSYQVVTDNRGGLSGERGNLIIAIKDDPKTFNPIYAGDSMSLTINNALYAPLMSVNNGEKKFVLAESLAASKDLKKFTLKLRAGLVWHDGQPLTTEDVLFTFNSILDEKQHSYFRSSFVLDGKPISVNKIDERTIEFVLPQASAAFESSLVQIIPIPKHIFEGEADLEKSEKNYNPVGSGPFKFKEYRSGEYVLVERADTYFAEKSKLDSITYRIAKENNSAVLALQNGELNMLRVEPQDYAKVKAAGNANLLMFPSGGVTTMVFNMNIDIMKQKEVRQAIVHALDKQELIQAGFSSTEFAEPAPSIFSPDTLYIKKELPAYHYDPDKSKALLKAAGAEGLKIRFAYFSASTPETNMALYLQQKLKEVGIQVELIPLDGAALGKKALNKDNTDYDMSFGGYSMGFEPDAYKVLYLSDAAYNYSHYKNEQFDQWWQQAAVETDSAKREQLYGQIQELSAQEITTYPIAYGKSIIAVDSRFAGIEEAGAKPVVMFDDFAKLYKQK